MFFRKRIHREHCAGTVQTYRAWRFSDRRKQFSDALLAMAVTDVSQPTAATIAQRETAEPAQDGKARVFISYSRGDADFAAWLHSGLEAHGVEVFQDTRDIVASEEWWPRLQQLIGRADTVVFVLSAGSAKSRECRREADVAIELHKRVFPVVIEAVEWSAVPEGLSKHHSIFFKETGDRVALGQLVTALATDIGWIREHTRLGELAEHWRAQGRPTGDLLRGRALDEAERWLIGQPNAAQPPTGLHLDYIQASRAAARERVRLVAAASIAVAIAMSGLGALAFMKKLEADAQKAAVQLENSQILNEFAKQRLRDGDPVTAILLALEALPESVNTSSRPDFPYAELTLHAAFRAQRERLVLGGRQADTPRIIRAAIFSRDGTRVVTAENDGRARVWDAATGRQLLALPEHGAGSAAAAQTVAFSPDGARILVGSDDGAAVLWDAATGEFLRRIPASKKPLRTAAFNPLDGGQILTAGLERSAALWNAMTGALMFPLTGHTRNIRSAAFAPDGRKIVTASQDGQAWVWSAETGECLVKLIGHGGGIESAVFSPEGKWILTAFDDGTAALWDVETGREVARVAGHGGRILFADFSPDGRYIVTASVDMTARVWDARRLEAGNVEGALKSVLHGHGGEVLKAMFTTDGRQLFTVSADNTARVWDTETGRQEAVLSGHEALVQSVAFDPKTLTVLTTSDDTTARLWRMEPERGFLALNGRDGALGFADFSADGNRLLTTSEDGTAVVWNALTGEKIVDLAGHGRTSVAAVFDPDAKRIATASGDGSAQIWDAATGRQLQMLPSDDKSALNSVAFSADGRSLLTASARGVAALWDSASGQRVRDFKANDKQLFNATFSPDGHRILTASADHAARIWDEETGRLLMVLGLDSEFRAAAFSANGGQVLTADAANVRIWDAETGKPVATYVSKIGKILSAAIDRAGADVVIVSDRKPYAYVWSFRTSELVTLGNKASYAGGGVEGEDLIEPVARAAFSADGRQVVTASEDGIVRVWDSRTGVQIDDLPGPDAPALYAAFGADDERIVTIYANRPARLWRVIEKRQSLLDYAKHDVPRCLTAKGRQQFGLSEQLPSWCATMSKWPTVDGE
jgi:WD40 repeat protein